MTAEQFVIWLKGFGEGMSFNDVSFLDAWQTIDAVMEEITHNTPPEPDFSASPPPLHGNPKVTPGPDVVDTDNNWTTNNCLSREGAERLRLRNLRDSNNG